MKKYIFLFFLSLYLLTMGGHFYSNDHYAMYMVTRNIVEYRSLEIPESPFSIQTAGGQSYSWYELGQSLIALPFYVTGKAADKIFKTDFLKQFFVASQNTLFAAGACLLLFMIAGKLKFGYRLALLLSFLYGAGTMAWVYSANFFAHTPASFLLLLAFYFLLMWNESRAPKHILLCSTVYGILLLTRIAMLPAAFWFTLYIVYKDRADKKRALSDVSLFLLPIAFFGGLILYHNWHRLGLIIIDARFLIPRIPLPESSFLNDWYRISFDGETGLFFFNPVLVFFIGGLFYLKKKKALILPAIIVLQSVLSVIILKRIDGRWCWGTRHLMTVLPFFALLTVFFFKENRNRILSYIFYALFFLSFTFQFSAVIANPMNFFLQPLHKNQVIHQLKQAKHCLIRPVPAFEQGRTYAQTWRARRFDGFDLWFLNLRAMGIRARFRMPPVILLVFINLFSAAKLFGHLSFSHREEK